MTKLHLVAIKGYVQQMKGRLQTSEIVDFSIRGPVDKHTIHTHVM